MAKTLTVYLAADLKNFNQGMDDAARRAAGLGGSMSGILGPALIGAGIAAGALAVKLGVDGVKAAVDDEAASAKLAQTLQNLGLAHNTEPVEDYISSLERSLGVADDELRPAYDRLVRSIGNTEEANRALALALDVSAGTGRSLDSVVQALGRAYDGNTAGLSRLGAGLDTATLRTGDMQVITAQLAATFSGQAQTSAQTFEGQIGRLSQAADNMKEAFGAGLLKALGDTNDATQGLVDAMEDLEPQLEAAGGLLGNVVAQGARTYSEAIGRAGKSSEETRQQIEGMNTAGTIIGAWLGELGASLTGPNSPLGVLSRLLGAGSEQAEELGVSIQYSAIAAERAVPGFTAITSAVDESGAEAADTSVRFLTLAEAMNAVGGGTFNWRREIAGATDDAQEFAIELNYNAWVAKMNAAAAAAAASATGRHGSSMSSATVEADKLTAAERRLTAAYEAQSTQFETTRATLVQHISDLEEAGQKARDYADGIRQGLTAGLDLAAAYQGQFTREGELTGVSLIEGFRQQVAQVKWFGDVLTAMKAQGADAGFIQEVAGLGPGIGGPLGEQLIKDGLVPTMSAEWVNVQDKINELGVQLVPEFMNQGIADAQALVNGMAEQLSKEGTRLSKLGKEIGKPVGASFKAQILEDVAEAVRAVEAAATAARAERVAQASAQQARVTEQAVAQAVASLVAKSDARTGRPTTAAPSRPVWVLG